MNIYLYNITYIYIYIYIIYVIIIICIVTEDICDSSIPGEYTFSSQYQDARQSAFLAASRSSAASKISSSLALILVPMQRFASWVVRKAWESQHIATTRVCSKMGWSKLSELLHRQTTIQHGSKPRCFKHGVISFEFFLILWWSGGNMKHHETSKLSCINCTLNSNNIIVVVPFHTSKVGRAMTGPTLGESRSIWRIHKGRTFVVFHS